MYQYLLRVQGQISSARDQSTIQSRRVYYTMCQFGFELKGTTRAKECRCNLIKLGVRLVDHFTYKNVHYRHPLNFVVLIFITFNLVLVLHFIYETRPGINHKQLNIIKMPILVIFYCKIRF